MRSQDLTRKYLTREYIVRKGDTLYSIARTELHDQSRWLEIHRLNKARLASPSALRPGMQLILPALPESPSSAIPLAADQVVSKVMPPVEAEVIYNDTKAPHDLFESIVGRIRRIHVVREGESLYSIAEERLGAASRWKEIAAWNPGKVHSPERPSQGIWLRLEPPFTLDEREVALPWGAKEEPPASAIPKKEPLTVWDRRVADATFVRAQDDLSEARTEAWFDDARRSRQTAPIPSASERATRAEGAASSPDTVAARSPRSLPDGRRIYTQPFVMRSRGADHRDLGVRVDGFIRERWQDSGNLAGNARDADHVILGEYWIEGAIVLLRAQIYEGLREISHLQWRVPLRDIEENSNAIDEMVSDLNERMR